MEGARNGAHFGGVPILRAMTCGQFPVAVYAISGFRESFACHRRGDGGAKVFGARGRGIIGEVVYGLVAMNLEKGVGL